MKVKFKPFFDHDFKSIIKSLWLGWWCINWWEGWSHEELFKGEHRFGKWVWTITYMPGGDY